MAASYSRSVSVLEAIDRSSFTARYWSMVAVILLMTMLEFFDFFLVGFIVSIIVPEWQLTFGEVAVVFLAAGVGAIAGSFLWGWLGDRWGRRLPLIAGILTFSVGSGVIALTPTGAVWLLSAFRFIVGAGVGGLVTISIPVIVEFTPTRYRNFLSGMATVGLVPLGTLLAAFLSARLGPTIGWRGLTAIGALPALLAIWAAMAVPESPRWLILQGRVADARRIVARLFGRPEESISLEVPTLAQPPEKPTYAALYQYRASFWFTIIAWLGATTAVYGILLWGPTILQLLLGVSAAQSADLFVYVPLAGFAGRIVFSVLSQWIGRRTSGVAMGLGGAAFLTVAAPTPSVFVGGLPLFLVLLALAAFFIDGGFTNLAPSTPEVFPTHLRTHAAGLSEVVNGLGKILGPVGLAFIAGTSNFIKPEVTMAAITPGFLYLAAFSVMTALGFLLIPETRGKTLEAVEEELGIAGAALIKQDGGAEPLTRPEASGLRPRHGRG